MGSGISNKNIRWTNGLQRSRSPNLIKNSSPNNLIKNGSPNSMVKNGWRHVDVMIENGIEKRVKDGYEKLNWVRIQDGYGNRQLINSTTQNQLLNSNRCLIREKQKVSGRYIGQKQNSNIEKVKMQKHQLIDKIHTGLRQQNSDLSNRQSVYESIKKTSNSLKSVNTDKENIFQKVKGSDKKQVCIQDLKKESEKKCLDLKFGLQNDGLVSRSKKQMSLDCIVNKNRQVKSVSKQQQKQSDIDGLCINSKRNLVKIRHNLKKSRNNEIDCMDNDKSDLEERLIRETCSSLLKETLKTEYIQTDHDRQQEPIFKAQNNQFDNLETLKTEHVKTQQSGHEQTQRGEQFNDRDIQEITRMNPNFRISHNYTKVMDTMKNIQKMKNNNHKFLQKLKQLNFLVKL